MYLTWGCDCSWIFQSWTSQSVGGLILGILLSFLASALSVGYSFYRSKFLNSNKITRTINFGLNYLIKIIIMFIVMSMNAWVCMAVIAGMTAGQIFFKKITIKQIKEYVLQS